MSTPSTSSNYLFDTSVLVEVLRGNAAIEQHMDALSGVGYLSAVASGELIFGAKHSSNPLLSLARTLALTNSLTHVSVDSMTADLYGDIRHDLATRGLLIPDNDIWIAATAAQYGLTFAARDAHFKRITGLNAELW